MAQSFSSKLSPIAPSSSLQRSSRLRWDQFTSDSQASVGKPSNKNQQEITDGSGGDGGGLWVEVSGGGFNRVFV